jgi:hypothetical protein
MSTNNPNNPRPHPDPNDRWSRESFSMRRMSKTNVWSLSIVFIAFAVIIVAYMFA